MKLDWQTTRKRARQNIRSLALVPVLLTVAPFLTAQALHPVTENGRTVWTNDVPASHVAVRTEATAAPPRTVPSKQYFYWSNNAQRWIPVQVPNPAALRSARRVAERVNQYIDSKPRLSSKTPKLSGELAKENPNYAGAAGNRSVSSAEIDKFIEESAARHHVDPNLVRALVKVESNYNPRALSNKGAMGLMQLMPDTARLYDVANPFDAKQNVDAGVRHLKGLLKNFKGDVPLTLAAYNAGEGAVQRSGGIPPYTETRNYVKRITTLMGSSSSDIHVSSLAMPIQVSRDERGHLLITNTY
jgi:soluble lytic murein transglycosylase-like protein